MRVSIEKKWFGYRLEPPFLFGTHAFPFVRGNETSLSWLSPTRGRGDTHALSISIKCMARFAHVLAGRSGPIPGEIGKLSALRQLNLGENRLSGNSHAVWVASTPLDFHAPGLSEHPFRALAVETYRRKVGVSKQAD